MPINRVGVRNVFIYNGATGDSLGGMRQNGSITEAVFLKMLSHVLLIVDTEFHVKARASQRIISPTSNPLEPGDYDVYSDSAIELTNEICVDRILSHSVSGKEDRFRDGIRQRDGKCVLSGFLNLNADLNDWSPFEAAHVFPLEKEDLWIHNNYNTWVTDMDAVTGSSKISSCQNGLLIRRDLHTMFDNYLISINPNDGYKISVFNRDIFGLDGAILDPVCRVPTDPHRVSDEILSWHFRQSVLANVKGAGAPIYEHDFPRGTDMVKEVLEGPNGQGRLEMEIASRLRGFEV